jgi:hypothetical protein
LAVGVPMANQLKLLVFVNALFVFLFVIYNWVEYSMLTSAASGLGSIRVFFPAYIQYSGGGSQANPGMFVDFYPNFTLLVFLAATTVNLYFIIKFQRSAQSKCSE